MNDKINAILMRPEDGSEIDETAECAAFRDGFLKFLEHTAKGKQWLQTAQCHRRAEVPIIIPAKPVLKQ